MSTFILKLHSMHYDIEIENVESFIATDLSGRFGIQAHHETFITMLSPGLVRYRDSKITWHYIAQPGASLVFQNNCLTLSSTQLILSDDRDEIITRMDKEWQAMAAAEASTKRNIVHMEQALTRKLIEMNQSIESL